MSWQQFAPTLYGSSTNVGLGYSGVMSGDGTTLAIGSISGDFTDIQNLTQFDCKLSYYKLINSSWVLKDFVLAPNSFPFIFKISNNGSVLVNVFQNKTNNMRILTIYNFTNNELNQIGHFEYSDIDNIALSENGEYFAVSSNGVIDIYKITQIVTKISTLNGDQPGETYDRFISFSNDGSILATAFNYGTLYTGADKAVGGRIVIYTRNGDTFSVLQQITETEANYYANSIRLQLSSSGQKLLIGLPNYNGSKGRIETYIRTLNGTYAKQPQTIDGQQINDEYGTSFRLSQDENSLVVISNRAIANDGVSKSAFLFYRAVESIWVNDNMSITNLNIAEKGAPLAYDINSDGTKFFYADATYNPPGMSSMGDQAEYGAVYTLTRSESANNSEGLPCFPTGTKVQTASGLKAVEDLNPASDRIVTTDNRILPFKMYKTHIQKTTKQTAPYLLPANCLAPNVPQNDLSISPLHAIQMRSGLWHIPKYAALSNSSITQPTIGTPTTYYHIELPNYFTDNIIAEGTVVESFGAKQTKGLQNVYKYNYALKGFTRISPPSQSKPVTLK